MKTVPEILQCFEERAVQIRARVAALVQVGDINAANYELRNLNALEALINWIKS